MDAVNGLLHDAEAVFERAAVLVLALVRDGHRKAVKQIAPVERVEVDARDAGGFHYRRGLDDGLLLGLDVVLGHLNALEHGILVNFNGRGREHCRVVPACAEG